MKRSRMLSIFRKGGEAAGPANNLPGFWTSPESPAKSLAEIPPQSAQTATATPPGLWAPPASLPELEKSRDSGLDRPRLVFAVDATGSREHAWKAAKKLTDALLKALPGELDVALAVHGGGRVHTFTRFTSKPGKLRDTAAGVRCKPGGTRLLDILARVLKLDRVGVVLYIGDCFEESEKQARELADALLKKETRVVILHDGPPPAAFAEIAERCGGALLPFDAAALDQLGELLDAVAALAVGGVELVEEQQATTPAAAMLLENLDPKRLLIGQQRR